MLTRMKAALAAAAIALTTAVAVPGGVANAATCTVLASGASNGFGAPGASRDYGRDQFCFIQYRFGNAYKMVFQGDGNLVAYKNQTAFWQSGTSGTGSKFALQSDGNMVVYSASNQPVWQSGTSSSTDQARGLGFNTPSQPSGFLVGACVFRVSDSTILWNTNLA